MAKTPKKHDDDEAAGVVPTSKTPTATSKAKDTKSKGPTNKELSSELETLRDEMAKDREERTELMKSLRDAGRTIETLTETNRTLHKASTVVHQDDVDAEVARLSELAVSVDGEYGYRFYISYEHQGELRYLRHNPVEFRSNTAAKVIDEETKQIHESSVQILVGELNAWSGAGYTANNLVGFLVD